MVEGNVVIAPNGKLVDVIRVDNWTNGNMAAILTVEDSNTLVFNPKEDIINFPGGGKNSQSGMIQFRVSIGL